jgi:flavodoxin II
MTANKRIGIFYGSTTCYTEMAAEKIQAALQRMTGQAIDLYDIKDTSLGKSADYDFIIYGISTWDFGELQEDWESTWDEISSLTLTGKTVALFGLGDQMGYADWFQDALGMLHDELIVLGCDIVGYWPSIGYEYTASKGVTEDGEYFVGLSLDDENQFDLSDQRIDQWAQQIVQEALID